MSFDQAGNLLNLDTRLAINATELPLILTSMNNPESLVRLANQMDSLRMQASQASVNCHDLLVKRLFLTRWIAICHRRLAWRFPVWSNGRGQIAKWQSNRLILLSIHPSATRLVGIVARCVKCGLRCRKLELEAQAQAHLHLSFGRLAERHLKR